MRIRFRNLQTQQVARTFSTGNPEGAITQWGQLGLRGEWVQRPIHACGIAEEAPAGLASFMVKKMGDRPFTPGYDGFLQSSQVVQRVAQDPAAIGFASANVRRKTLAL